MPTHTPAPHLACVCTALLSGRLAPTSRTLAAPSAGCSPWLCERPTRLQPDLGETAALLFSPGAPLVLTALFPAGVRSLGSGPCSCTPISSPCSPSASGPGTRDPGLLLAWWGGPLSPSHTSGAKLPHSEACGFASLEPHSSMCQGCCNADAPSPGSEQTELPSPSGSGQDGPAAQALDRQTTWKPALPFPGGKV